MVNKIIIIFSLFILVACSSGGGGGNGGNTVPGDFVGVWDVSTDYGAMGIDEYYTVIRSDGTGTDYDYAGDSFDNVANCYWIDNYTITHQGGDSFQLRYSDNTTFDFTATVSNDVMTYTIPGFGTRNAPRSTLQESDFTPVC